SNARTASSPTTSLRPRRWSTSSPATTSCPGSGEAGHWSSRALGPCTRRRPPRWSLRSQDSSTGCRATSRRANPRRPAHLEMPPPSGERVQGADYDVLVVGAGPTGSNAARLLAAGGWKVLLVEEHPEVGHPVQCAG